MAILRQVSTIRVLSYMRTEQLFLYVHQIESVSSNDNCITYDEQIVQNKISEKLYGWTLEPMKGVSYSKKCAWKCTIESNSLSQ